MNMLHTGKLCSRVHLTLLAAIAAGIFFLAPAPARAQFPGTLYVACADGSVNAIDTSDFSVFDWAAAAQGGYLNGMTIVGNNLFGANTEADAVDVFNASTGAGGGPIISGSTGLGTTSDPWAMATDGTGNFFVGFQDGSISKFNATTGAMVDQNFAGPDGGFVYSMSEYNGMLYVLALNSSFVNSVSVYNATTDAVVNPSLISGVSGSAMTVDDGGIFIDGSGKVGEYSLTGSLINGNVITGMGYSEAVSEDNGDVFAGDYNNEDVDESTIAGAVVGAPVVTLTEHPSALLVVPEPATWSLLAGGVAMLFAIWRRRNVVAAK